MANFVCEIPIPFYVYKITCLPTGQYYFGYRKRHVSYNRQPEEDLWSYYFTSSSEIQDLLSQYTKDDFDAKIIHKSFDLDDCFWREQTLIKEHFADPLLLNKTYHDQSLGHRIFIPNNDTCKFCQKLIGSGNITIHEKSCKSNPNKQTVPRKKFPCQHCGVLRIPGALTAHERSCHNNLNAVKLKNKSAGVDVCKFCNKLFNLIGLPKHEKRCDFNLTAYDQVTECPHCKLQIANKNRSSHIEHCQSKIRIDGSKQHKIHCSFCQKLIGSCAIERHQSTCNFNPNRIDKKFEKKECVFCNNWFGKTAITKHTNSCTNNPNSVKTKSKTGKCSKCSKSIGMHVLSKHTKSCKGI